MPDCGWLQLTPVDGDPGQVALAGEEGVGVDLGVAVDLLLVGDDRVDLGAVDLVTRACGGWAYEGGGSRSRKGSRRRIRDGRGSLPQLGGGAPTWQGHRSVGARWHAAHRWAPSLAKPCVQHR